VKRSTELSQLSRDHHKALYAAMRLRRADERTSAEAVGVFAEFWRGHGNRHFQIEEEVLLPGFALGGGDPRDELIARVLTDHGEIRARARALTSESPLNHVHELGERLTSHVRLEEDKLFPRVEQALGPDALAALGQDLESAERIGRIPGGS